MKAASRNDGIQAKNMQNGDTVIALRSIPAFVWITWY